MERYCYRLADIRFSELMEVYDEGNRENAAADYPNEPEGLGILHAEQDFFCYLRDVFFRTEGAVYALWEVQGRYVSALRLEPYRDGLLMQAVETLPECRRRGYATELLGEVLEKCEHKVYSHVRRSNTASMGLHRKLGFRQFSDTAVYLDGTADPGAVTFVFIPDTLNAESAGKKG